MDLSWAQEFVAKYGYLAVFLGALIEGEAIIITASVFASQGLLSIKTIAIISFLGTLFADQFLFQVGRNFQGLIQANHQGVLGSVKARVSRLIKSRPNLLLFTFRFIYGIRIATPILVGMHNFPVRRFAVINLLAALLWTFVVCGTGYFLGYAILSQNSLIQYITASGICISYAYLLYSLSRI